MTTINTMTPVPTLEALGWKLVESGIPESGRYSRTQWRTPFGYVSVYDTPNYVDFNAHECGTFDALSFLCTLTGGRVVQSGGLRVRVLKQQEPQS
jgi:hypothetical protein